MNLRTYWKTAGGLFALWFVSVGCQTATQTTSSNYCPNCKQHHTTAGSHDHSIPMNAPASEIAPGPILPFSRTQAPQLLPAPAPEVSSLSERETEAIQVHWVSESR